MVLLTLSFTSLQCTIKFYKKKGTIWEIINRELEKENQLNIISHGFFSKSFRIHDHYILPPQPDRKIDIELRLHGSQEIQKGENRTWREKNDENKHVSVVTMLLNTQNLQKYTRISHYN